MKNQYLLFFGLFIFMLSCKEKKSKIDPNNEIVEQLVEVEPEIVDVSENKESQNKIDEEVTVRGRYTAPGAIINVPVSVVQEYTYKNGKLIREMSSSSSGGTNMRFTQEYDDNGRVVNLVTTQNGERSVLQVNEYTDDDLLLSEFRIEKSSSGYDTILYEYHYPQNRPNPMNYYRTNNGVKVTEMSLTTNGRKETLVERAVGSKDYIGIITTRRTKNKQGKVTSEQVTYINSDWQNKSKLDTTINEPSIVEYNEQGLITRQKTSGGLSLNGEIVNEYTKDGILSRRTIKRVGKPQSIIKFTKVQ